jgi:predicted N-acetyltransferase YhbS
MTPDSIPPKARTEQAQDHLQIYAVSVRAFGQHNEARLVNQIRQDGDLLASSVGVSADLVLGHAALSPAHMGDQAVLTLGPVSVLSLNRSGGVAGQVRLEQGQEG